MVNYDVAFRKPFTDIKKLLIGILLSILPIVNWFAKGFIIECSGVGKYKPGKKMPEWKNFPNLFFKGFIVSVIAFIYTLPGMLILALGLLFSLSGAVLKIIVSEITNENWQTLLPYLVGIIPFIIVSVLFLIVASYLVPAANLSFLKKKKFSAAFDLPLVFRKAFTMQYFLAILTWFLVLTVGAMVTRWIPILGGTILFFIVGVIGYSLVGQAYQEAK